MVTSRMSALAETGKSFMGAPPRRVGYLAWLPVLFGGSMNQFGWCFFAFGMIFVWLFVANCDCTSW